MRAYRAEVAQLAEKYLGRPLKEIDLAAMIQDIVYGATKYGLEMPPDFLMVGKALMTMEGVGKEIDPDLDVFGEMRPYFFDILRKRYSPERVGNELWRGIERLSGAAYDMPQQLREILDDLRLGRLTLQTTNPALPDALDRLGRSLFSGLVVAAFVVVGHVARRGGSARPRGRRPRRLRRAGDARHMASPTSSAGSGSAEGRRGLFARGMRIRRRRCRAEPVSGDLELARLDREPAGVSGRSCSERRNAMTSAKSTSDSMSARPRIIGVWMRAAAPGLREMPSSAAAAARAWPWCRRAPRCRWRSRRTRPATCSRRTCSRPPAPAPCANAMAGTRISAVATARNDRQLALQRHPNQLLSSHGGQGSPCVRSDGRGQLSRRPL